MWRPPLSGRSASAPRRFVRWESRDGPVYELCLELDNGPVGLLVPDLEGRLAEFIEELYKLCVLLCFPHPLPRETRPVGSGLCSDPMH
jgi:hypothetical protein